MQPTDMYLPDRSTFDGLPPDHYGVLVANEMDVARLKWLAEAIGETKLRRSVTKYRVRYPDSQPFVSLLLKWYHLKVPVRLYAAVPVPVYWVYILRMQRSPKIKIGMTGRWPYRAWDFVRKSNVCDPDRVALALTIDLEASKAWLVGGNKAEAKRRESILKKALSPWRVEAPWKDGDTNYGAAGHKEWFDASQSPAAIALASSFDSVESSTSTTSQTLAAALDLASHDSVFNDNLRAYLGT